MESVVFHVDADAFFAACHLAVDEGLRGIPLVVGGDPKTRHGIVLTATYEARAFGVRTAMPIAQALKLCPRLTVIPPEGRLYSDFSRKLRTLFDAFTPVVEPASIDEAWLDMGGGVLRRFGDDPLTAARDLQDRAQQDIGLSVSVGAARNKMLAKQASDMEKPHGLTTLWPEEVAQKLWPLPVRALYGVGPKLSERLEGEGIHTVGDLAREPAERLRARYGAYGEMLGRRARGADSTPVAVPVPGQEQSLSVERTLSRDVTTARDADAHLLALANDLAARLRAHDHSAVTIVLKYKTARFELRSRRRTLDSPTRSEEVLWRTGLDLFRSRPDPGPVRLLGLGVTNLAPDQGDLFDDPRERLIADTVDSIRSRFGTDAIGRARLPLKRRGAPSTFRRTPEPRDE